MEFIFIILILLIDQGSKALARIKLQPVDTIQIVEDFFSLTYVENRGAAFGIFSNHRFLLVGVTAIVVLLMIIYLMKNKNMSRMLKIGLVLVIAGAIGNMIDRVWIGFVTDFIHVYLGEQDLPVFNFADISVVTGTILLATSLVLTKE